MRGKSLVIGIFVFLLAVGMAFAGEEDKKSTGSKVELVPVYEKIFDEPIVDVIFDTARVSIEEAKKIGWREEIFTIEDKTKGRVLISYPKVVLTSRRRGLSRFPNVRRSSYYAKDLRFYNEKGEVLSQLELSWEEGAEYVCFSPKKKYLVVNRIPTEWNPSYSGGTIYDLDGRKIWEIEKPTPIAISDEGYMIASYRQSQIPPEPGGDFYVYGPKGNLIATIENPKKTKVCPHFARFSRNGNYVILYFVKPAAIPTILLLITKEGEILWEKEMVGHYSRATGEIDILQDKGVVGCIYKGELRTYCLDWAGNLRWDAPLTASGYGYCIFAQDGERVYASSSKGYLWCFDIKTGDIVWMHKEPWSPPLEGRRGVPGTPEFREIYELDQNVVVNGTYKLFLFDSKTGKLKAAVEYPDTRIFLSLHNGKIFVINVKDKKILGLKIKEG